MSSLCEQCFYNTLDEETEEFFCSLTLDEDEYARMLFENSRECKYFRPDVDEYGIVRKQN